MNFIIKSIATVFGIGYFPLAPGTISSLFCLVFFWFAPEFPVHLWVIVIVVLFFLGVWVSTEAEKIWNLSDPSFIVIDEFVGQLITIFAFQKKISVVVGAFILFRFFDVIKCGPMRYSEKLRNGWGVMMDDVIAGMIGHVILRCILFLV